MTPINRQNRPARPLRNSATEVCHCLKAANQSGFGGDRGRCAAAVYVQPESRQDEGIARFWRKKDGEQFAKLVQLLHFRELAIAKSQSFLI